MLFCEIDLRNYEHIGRPPANIPAVIVRRKVRRAVRRHLLDHAEEVREYPRSPCGNGPTMRNDCRRENRERSRATLLSGFSQMSGSQSRNRRRRGGVRRRAPDRSHVLVHQNRISVGIDSDETGRSGCGLVGLQLELHSLSLELPLQFAYVGE